MNNSHMIYYISLCLVLPIFLLCFYLERRARRIIVSMICGVVAGIGAYFLNNWLKGLLGIGTVTFSMYVAPIAEELLKFIPVVAIHCIVKKGRRGSAANAYAVGLGFCVCENFMYLFNSLETATAFWLISRCVGAGLMHSMTTTLMGIGIYSARTGENNKLLRVLISLLGAIAFHMVFNILAQTGLQLIALMMPILAYLILFFILKKENLLRFFREEFPEK